MRPFPAVVWFVLLAILPLASRAASPPAQPHVLFLAIDNLGGLVIANDDGIMTLQRGLWKRVEGKYPETFPEAKRKKTADLAAELAALRRSPGRRQR